jgi:hypothetical protein
VQSVAMPNVAPERPRRVVAQSAPTSGLARLSQKNAAGGPRNMPQTAGSSARRSAVRIPFQPLLNLESRARVLRAMMGCHGLRGRTWDAVVDVAAYEP